MEIIPSWLAKFIRTTFLASKQSEHGPKIVLIKCQTQTEIY